MNIETPELMLEELSYKDLKQVHELHSYPEVDKFSTIGIPKSLDETNEIIQVPILDQYNSTRKNFAWKIVLKSSTEFIGVAELIREVNQFRKGVISFNLVPENWNNGYATNAVKAVVNFGFEALLLHRIEAVCAIENMGAIRVLEKSGFSKEGILKQNLPIRNQWMDSFLYALISKEEEEK